MYPSEWKIAIAGKPCSHKYDAYMWEQGLPAIAIDQPPMIFMMVAPPENATSCLSPNALTSKR